MMFNNTIDASVNDWIMAYANNRFNPDGFVVRGNEPGLTMYVGLSCEDDLSTYTLLEIGCPLSRVRRFSDD